MRGKLLFWWMGLLLIGFLVLVSLWFYFSLTKLGPKLYLFDPGLSGPIRLASRGNANRFLEEARYKGDRPFLVFLINKDFPWQNPNEQGVIWQFPNEQNNAVRAAGCAPAKSRFQGRLRIMRMGVIPKNYLDYISREEAEQKFNNLFAICSIYLFNPNIEEGDFAALADSLVQEIDSNPVFRLSK